VDAQDAPRTHITIPPLDHSLEKHYPHLIPDGVEGRRISKEAPALRPSFKPPEAYSPRLPPSTPKPPAGYSGVWSEDQLPRGINANYPETPNPLPDPATVRAGTCEPQPKGPKADAGAEAERLKKEVARLDRDLKRQQALTRATQRAIGLVGPAAKPDKKEGKGGSRRRRRPTVRGLRAAEHLKAQGSAEAVRSSQEG
jgi:hypothetical protein